MNRIMMAILVLLGGMLMEANSQVSTTVSGNLFFDLTPNCGFDAGDVPLNDWIICAYGQDTCYATADDLGQYALSLNNGTYVIDVHIPEPANLLWDIDCPFNNTITVSGSTQNITLDIPMSVDTPFCGSVQIDVSTDQIVNCGETEYWVRYCNFGNINLTQLSIDVILDEHFSGKSATLPWNTPQTGNKFRFYIGNLDVNGCGSFKFTTQHICANAALGQSHTVTAVVVDENLCTEADFKFTGSNVVATATCINNNTVKFTVKNEGGSAMVDPTTIDFIEDIILQRDRDTIQLPVNGVSEYVRPANGSTQRMIVRQATDGPKDSKPSIAVEGCGTNDNNDFSRGYMTLFANNDLAIDIELDIQESKAPGTVTNTVYAYPMGVGTDHYIEHDDHIEYHFRYINNTESTINDLLIVDTISDYLFPASLQTGVSSHEYDFDLLCDGIAHFNFEDIDLDDGDLLFMKFKIRQKAANSAGSVIMNKATAIADNAAPVALDDVMHTVGVINADYLIMDTTTAPVSIGTIDDRKDLKITAYPNPASSYFYIEAKGIENYPALKVEIIDITGKMVLEQPFEQGKLRLETMDIPGNGLFIYQIKSEGRLMSIGKMFISK